MLLQKQPNSWSCLPTAFASILGVAVKDFIDLLGHNGSEIIWPTLPPPLCYRGWHIQEIYTACLTLYYAVTPFEKVIASTARSDVNPFVQNQDDCFNDLIQATTGVLAVTTEHGNGHVIIFDDKKFFNPATGQQTTIKLFKPRNILWVVNRIKNNSY